MFQLPISKHLTVKRFQKKKEKKKYIYGFLHWEVILTSARWLHNSPGLFDNVPASF